MYADWATDPGRRASNCGGATGRAGPRCEPRPQTEPGSSTPATKAEALMDEARFIAAGQVMAVAVVHAVNARVAGVGSGPRRRVFCVQLACVLDAAVSLTGGVRKGQNLTWTLTWVRNMIDLPVGAFNTDLASLRFNWPISTKSYSQTPSQYSNRTNRRSHNVRLGLLSTSATRLFVVYNTGMLLRDYINPHSVERRLEAHAFSIKLNYLLDY